MSAAGGGGDAEGARARATGAGPGVAVRGPGVEGRAGPGVADRGPGVEERARAASTASTRRDTEEAREGGIVEVPKRRESIGTVVSLMFDRVSD